MSRLDSSWLNLKVTEKTHPNSVAKTRSKRKRAMMRVMTTVMTAMTVMTVPVEVMNPQRNLPKRSLPRKRRRRKHQLIPIATLAPHPILTQRTVLSRITLILILLGTHQLTLQLKLREDKSYQRSTLSWHFQTIRKHLSKEDGSG